MSKARGLCWGCYQKPSVRAKYTSGSVFSNRAIGPVDAEPKPASAPCPWPVGSRGRFLTMRGRLARGESLSHPGDSTEVCVEFFERERPDGPD